LKHLIIRAIKSIIKSGFAIKFNSTDCIPVIKGKGGALA